MTPNPSPMHTGKPGLSTLLVKSGVQNRWELQPKLGHECHRHLEHRVQVVDVHQATDRQLPEARYTFVDGMVVFEVLALQVFAALSPRVEPDEDSPDVVLRAFIRAEVAGQRVSSSMASYNDARIRSKASGLFMTISHCSAA